MTILPEMRYPVYAIVIAGTVLCRPKKSKMNFMKTKNRKGSGQDFIDQQKDTDSATNRRIKKEKGNAKLDPQEANNPGNRSRQTDAASKKTGGGKQKGPGM
jgi:hypothetical protein